jgi:hypothetical protein
MIHRLADAIRAAGPGAEAQAKAALTALRDPTPPMVAAAQQVSIHQPELDELQIWRAMIAAALVDGHLGASEP